MDTSKLRIGFLIESSVEPRLAIVPKLVKKYVDLGIDIYIQSGLGKGLFTDQEFINEGALLFGEDLTIADIYCQVNCPDKPVLEKLNNKIVISFLNSFTKPENIECCKKFNITMLGMEFIPRSTYAQKMDALSSQASIAGYVAVMVASTKLTKILPMMVTPSGTLSPAKVFIIGAGVAGLQAIATAKRLGAKVEAFDTRAAVKEQVESLGAKFLKIDLGETGQTKDGYAKELSADQIQKQQEMMLKACKQSDIIITTAQLFGKKAPIIITKKMIASLTKGTVIVDMAAETGGNVEGSIVNKPVETQGVTILGPSNLAGEVPEHASEMYGSNVYNLIKDFYNKESKSFDIDSDNEIAQSILITKNGECVQPYLKKNEKKPVAV